MSKLLYTSIVTFSVKTEYALRALVEIADDHSPTRRQDIAERQEIPVHYLEQILLSLKKSGIIGSTKGPGGGFRLKKPLEELNLWDIFEAVEFEIGTPMDSSCYPGYVKDCHADHNCRIRGIWLNLRKSVTESMKQITLQSLVREKSQEEESHAIA